MTQGSVETAGIYPPFHDVIAPKGVQRMKHQTL
ncbi:hypothetical protein SM11_pD0423 (plasmid) [Sinorhizobium meliloti SM11]|uniref:Uncharacterized protein n=1 Tax=Sinorhizobium meliloti (strain SM11) TaxID=707241 RepID=F7XJS7_SINMM|nr:hypothetical protein SM11_pD0423 [Sinorhizobium meliloti SM11]